MRRLAIVTGMVLVLTACQWRQESTPINRARSSSSMRSRVVPSSRNIKPASVSSVVSNRETIILQSSTSEKNRLMVDVEIADEPGEWETGLMFRDTLDGGMLFVFPNEKERSFWMKNTRIPLDILYFSAIGELVSVQTMIPCVKDPCEMYPSNGPARYALEVPAGYVEKHDIEGDWIMGFSGESGR